MTGRRVGTLGLLLLLLGAACGGGGEGEASPASPDSTSPALLPGEIRIDTPVTSNVSIDASSDGRTVAIGWYSYDEAAAVERAMVATSSDGGTTFGPPTVVAEPAVQYPDVAVLDDGTVLVGSITYDAAANIDPSDQRSWPGWPVIHRSTDGGATFEVMADLRSTIGDRVLTGGMPTSLAATGDGSTVVFSFQDQTPPEFVAPGQPARSAESTATPTFAVVSVDGGATFATPQVASTSTCGCCQSTAFIADGRAGVAMRLLDPVTNSSDERDPGLNLADRSGTFGEPIEIHDDQFQMPLDGCPASGPAVDEAGGIAHTAWWTGADGRRGWWYARGDSVTALGEPVALETDYTITYAVHLAADPSGQAWVVGMHWPDDSGGNHLWLWHVDAAGSPQLLDVAPPVAPAARAYDIATVDGHGLLAWMTDDAVHIVPVDP